MTADGLIAVTGATGGLGGRVARRLADRGVAQRLIVRDPSRAPDLPGAEVAAIGGYDDLEGLAAALLDVRTLFLVSAKEDADRVALHAGAVDAAVAAGVERVVYTSFVAASPACVFTFGRDHWATEEHIRATSLDWTFLRDSMYLDFLPLMADEHGVIRGPADEGRCAWVARDDIADVAVPVLTEGGHSGQAYDMTGPEARTFASVAAELSAHVGREIRFEDETIDEAYASRSGYGAEQFELDGWVTTYVAIAAGELDVVSDDVERIAGHRPLDLHGFLEANPDAVAALRGAT